MAHVRLDHAQRGLIGSILDRAFEFCDKQLTMALDQCAADDRRRRSLLPPECGNES